MTVGILPEAPGKSWGDFVWTGSLDVENVEFNFHVDVVKGCVTASYISMWTKYSEGRKRTWSAATLDFIVLTLNVEADRPRDLRHEDGGLRNLRVYNLNKQWHSNQIKEFLWGRDFGGLELGPKIFDVVESRALREMNGCKQR